MLLVCSNIDHGGPLGVGKSPDVLQSEAAVVQCMGVGTCRSRWRFWLAFTVSGDSGVLMNSGDMHLTSGAFQRRTRESLVQEWPSRVALADSSPVDETCISRNIDVLRRE